jgi:hypothetical protein
MSLYEDSPHEKGLEIVLRKGEQVIEIVQMGIEVSFSMVHTSMDSLQRIPYVAAGTNAPTKQTNKQNSMALVHEAATIACWRC